MLNAEHPNIVTEIDPICGMTVDPANAAGSSTREGKTYYFCGVGCKKKFDAGPVVAWWR